MTRSGLMRTLLPSRLFRHAGLTGRFAGRAPTSSTCNHKLCHPSSECRCFAQVKETYAFDRDIYFRSSAPTLYSVQGETMGDHKPPDQRTLQLGKTVRTIHERLPTLLLSPLPQEILSPQITLHLFPSTHPHLPTVSGRIAYTAALWTAPVAWGRIPLVGNVKLAILSERMVRNGGSAVPQHQREEKLIVKWKTSGKTSHRDGSGGVYRGIGIGTQDPVDKIKQFIAGTSNHARNDDGADGGEEEFCGIFIFEFDEQGKVRKHVIEHTEEGGHWDKTARVVSVTDWLLGQFSGSRNKENMPELALCEERPKDRSPLQMIDLASHTRRRVSPH